MVKTRVFPSQSFDTIVSGLELKNKYIPCNISKIKRAKNITSIFLFSLIQVFKCNYSFFFFNITEICLKYYLFLDVLLSFPRHFITCIFPRACLKKTFVFFPYELLFQARSERQLLFLNIFGYGSKSDFPLFALTSFSIALYILYFTSAQSVVSPT